MRYTKSQSKAIHHEGQNILVSASAGSGKTGVLKARVLRKIHDGVDIDQLIVLTFTEAAAAEMKSRIINELNKEGMTQQLIKMDNAIISTFDAFTLRLVRTYHYLLDLPSDISISDRLLIEMASRESLDSVIQSYYQKNDPDFNDLLVMMFSGNDHFLSSAVLRLAKALKKIPNYQRMIEDYELVFNEDMVKAAYKTYFDLIKDDIHLIVQRFNRYYINNYQVYSEECDIYLDTCKDCFSHLADKDASIDDFIQKIVSFKLPSRPRKPRHLDEWLETDTEDIKAIKTIHQELMDCHILDINYLDAWQETLPRVKILLNMTKDYLEQMALIQKEKDLYGFDDMMNFAIRLFEDHKDVKAIYQENINEILIDEYQDTNDLQDYFISLIANHNIFMVGDVKQSIYRFRDANPNNFMRLLNQYQNNQQGKAIRLSENFRSNRHLLQGINDLFFNLMLPHQGGVDYKDHHALVSGYDKDYLLNHQHRTSLMHFYDLEAIQETYEDLKKEEIEATIVANDIIRKIEKRQPIFDGGDLREITYSDITILVDRKTSFSQYQKVLSSFSIPVDVYDKTAFSDSDEIIFINQFLILMDAYIKKDMQIFKQALYSVARSFVYQIDDGPIIHQLIQGDKDLEFLLAHPAFEALYKDLKTLSPLVNQAPNLDIVDSIYKRTRIYEKLVHLDNPGSSEKKLDYFRHLIAGQTSVDFSDLIKYLNFIQEQRSLDIEYKESKDQKQAVKLMSIHASKGLQFPVVYMMGLYKRFNFTENKESFNFSKDYGVLTYGYDQGFYRTFLERLYFRQGLSEDVSEKVRLLYVAMTRAKEELNFLLEDNQGQLKDPIRFNNYQDMIYAGYKLKPYDVVSNLIMPEKKEEKDLDLNSSKIIHKQFSFEQESIDESHFSKKESGFFDDDIKAAMAYGDNIHQLLEDVDFSQPSQDLGFLPKQIQESIKHLKASDLFKSLKSPRFYQEYEFIDHSSNYDRQGIIDLLIIDQEKCIILDYKLKQIDEPAYVSQLKGYKDYLESLGQTNIYGYLYSLIDQELKKVF